MVQGQVVYIELSSTARLPCGSTSRPFPSDASRVYWYKGDDVKDSSAIMLNYKFNDSSTRYYNDYSPAKHSCSSDGVLSITDVQTGDQENYTCQAYGSAVPFVFTIKLDILGLLVTPLVNISSYFLFK